MDESSPGYLLAKEVTTLRCAINYALAALKTSRFALAITILETLAPPIDYVHPRREVER